MTASANVSADNRSTVASTPQIAHETTQDKTEVALSSFAKRDNSKQKCMLCGGANHVHRYCPAKDVSMFQLQEKRGTLPQCADLNSKTMPSIRPASRLIFWLA